MARPISALAVFATEEEEGAVAAATSLQRRNRQREILVLVIDSFLLFSLGVAIAIACLTPTILLPYYLQQIVSEEYTKSFCAFAVSGSSNYDPSSADLYSLVLGKRLAACRVLHGSFGALAHSQLCQIPGVTFALLYVYSDAFPLAYRQRKRAMIKLHILISVLSNLALVLEHTVIHRYMYLGEIIYILQLCYVFYNGNWEDTMRNIIANGLPTLVIMVVINTLPYLTQGIGSFIFINFGLPLAFIGTSYVVTQQLQILLIKFGAYDDSQQSSLASTTITICGGDNNASDSIFVATNKHVQLGAVIAQSEREPPPRSTTQRASAECNSDATRKGSSITRVAPTGDKESHRGVQAEAHDGMNKRAKITSVAVNGADFCMKMSVRATLMKLYVILQVTQLVASVGSDNNPLMIIENVGLSTVSGIVGYISSLFLSVHLRNRRRLPSEVWRREGFCTWVLRALSKCSACRSRLPCRQESKPGQQPVASSVRRIIAVGSNGQNPSSAEAQVVQPMVPAPSNKPSSLLLPVSPPTAAPRLSNNDPTGSPHYHRKATVGETSTQANAPDRGGLDDAHPRGGDRRGREAEVHSKIQVVRANHHKGLTTETAAKTTIHSRFRGDEVGRGAKKVVSRRQLHQAILHQLQETLRSTGKEVLKDDGDLRQQRLSSQNLFHPAAPRNNMSSPSSLSVSSRILVSSSPSLQGLPQEGQQRVGQAEHQPTGNKNGLEAGSGSHRGGQRMWAKMALSLVSGYFFAAGSLLGVLIQRNVTFKLFPEIDTRPLLCPSNSSNFREAEVDSSSTMMGKNTISYVGARALWAAVTELDSLTLGGVAAVVAVGTWGFLWFLDVVMGLPLLQLWAKKERRPMISVMGMTVFLYGHYFFYFLILTIIQREQEQPFCY